MNEQRLLISATVLTTCLMGATGAHAREMQVRAPVIDVETVRAADTVVEECADRPAASGRSPMLGATLAWDLGLTCTSRRVPSDVVSGYRVYYKWDNRIYNQVMDEPPGATVALKIRLE